MKVTNGRFDKVLAEPMDRRSFIGRIGFLLVGVFGLTKLLHLEDLLVSKVSAEPVNGRSAQLSEATVKEVHVTKEVVKDNSAELAAAAAAAHARAMAISSMRI